MNGNVQGTFYWNDTNWYRNTICEADPDPKRTASVTDEAISFLTRRAADYRPFYLQVSYYAIHTAFQAEQETLERYRNMPGPTRRVAGGIAPMLDDLDAAIGRLTDTVGKLGLGDRTYIFLTSDNGGEYHTSFWDENAPSRGRNYPLRLHKQTLYEGGIRVPFIAKGPGIQAGSICHEPVAGYDLLPTFYDLAGGTEPVPQELDGGSLCELLFNGGKGEVKRGHAGLYFHRPDPPNRQIQGHSAWRKGDFKLIVFWTPEGSVDRTELYNLRNDISEQCDLSRQMPEKTREMLSGLLSYLRELDE
jgi:arylsulfatase A-like enzyme